MAFTVISIAPPPNEIFEWFHYNDELQLEAFGVDRLGNYSIDKSQWNRLESTELQTLPGYGKLLRASNDKEYYQLNGELTFRGLGAHKSDSLDI